MRLLAATLLSLALVPSLATADEMADELEALAGTWRLTAMVAQGQEVPEAHLPPITLTVYTDGTLVGTAPDGSDMSIDFTVNLDTSPKQVDFVHTSGEATGMSQYGIYELSGDTMVTAATDPGADESERPGDLSGDSMTFARD